MIALVDSARVEECRWCHKPITVVRVRRGKDSWSQDEAHPCVKTALGELVEPSRHTLNTGPKWPSAEFERRAAMTEDQRRKEDGLK